MTSETQHKGETVTDLSIASENPLHKKTQRFLRVFLQEDLSLEIRIKQVGLLL